MGRKVTWRSFSKSWLQASSFSFWSPVMKPKSNEFSYCAPKDTLGNSAWQNVDQAVVELMGPISVKKPQNLKSTRKHCLQKAAILLQLLPEFGGVGGSSPTLHHLLDSLSFLLLPQSWLTGNWQQTLKCNWLMKIHCFAISHCLWQHGENMHLWVCIVICRTERLHWHLLCLWAGADYYPTYKDL